MNARMLGTIGLALLLLASAGAARRPSAELAGIRFGMTEEQVRGKLSAVGALRREPRRGHEKTEPHTWVLKRGAYAYVVVGFAKERVDWVTAFVRQRGARVRFSDIGPLDACERPGHRQCVWNVGAAGSDGAYSVIARGRDSVNVSSISLKRR